MKPPVYCLVSLKIREESLNFARRQMREVEKEVRNSAGCLQYHYLQNLDDPTMFTGYGIFATNKDLHAHFEMMRTRTNRSEALKQMLDPEVELTVQTLDRV